MSENDLTKKVLNQVLGSVERILYRFESVSSMDWFLVSYKLKLKS